MSSKIDLSPIATKAKNNIIDLTKGISKKQKTIKPLKIESMEEALYLTGYMDKVKFVADSQIKFPKQKSLVEQFDSLAK